MNAIRSFVDHDRIWGTRPTFFKASSPQNLHFLHLTLHDNVRRNDGNAAEWAAMLMNVYSSRYAQKVLPGLRAEITNSLGAAPADRVRSLLVFSASMAAPLDVNELN